MLQQSKQRAAVVRWEASRSGARARRASSAAAQRRRRMRRGEEVKPREEEVKPRSSPSPSQALANDRGVVEGYHREQYIHYYCLFITLK